MPASHRSAPHLDDPRPLLRVVALTLIVVLAALAGLAGLERPAAAQTAASRGALFDNAPDVTLPSMGGLTQITRVEANDGYVHFPFAAPDIRTLLGGSTFNGTASLPDGRSLTVRTGAAVDGYTGGIVFFDRLIFGLSPSDDPAECNFEALARELGTEPSTKQHIAINYAFGDENSPGAKLGFVRIEPSLEVSGTYLCMRRETQVLEVNNSSPKYYDLQRSPTAISTAWINTGFIGSRSDPDRVEEDEAEPAPEPEPAAEAEEEADADAGTEEDSDADAEDADAEDAEDADAEDADAEDVAPDADQAGDDGAEADDAASGEVSDDAADTVTSASDDGTTDEGSTDDAGGDGVLIPVLLGLIVLLLAGLLLVLARRGRDTRSPVAAAVAAPVGDSAPSAGATDGEDTDPGAGQP